MSYTIDSGSISEALLVDAAVPEFERKKTVAELTARLDGKQSLILIAKCDGVPVGYLVGYALSETTLYNWLTGIAPAHRNHGLAGRLLSTFEHQAASLGYRELAVKSKNCFPAMLRLLIGQGYQISHYESLGDLMENKIHFIKPLAAEQH